MRPLSLVVLAGVLLLPACSTGPTLIKVSGSVNYNQKPLGTYDGLNVIFVPVVEAGSHHDSYPADVSRTDGSFTVPGRDGLGIPPGKYKVTVNQMSFTASDETKKINDLFTLEKTQLIFDISADTSLTIDLSKSSGK
ncbi:MAG: hypothetical protein FJ303_11200 [Planctomycetes bacterium]|nr:hypothetical protein [Planctomycetota bacterium]